MTVYINARFMTQNCTGVQRVAGELSMRLPALLNHNIVFLCPKGQLKNALPNIDLRQFGCLKGHLWEQIEMPLFLFRQKAPYILLNFCNSAPLLIQNKLTTVHDMSVFQKEKWFKLHFKLFYRLLFSCLIRGNSTIVTVSNFSRDEILRVFPSFKRENINVVYHGNIRKNEENAVAQNRESFFLAVSSMDPRKNIETILKAFNNPKHKIKLIGGGGNAFRDIQYSNSENIEFLGFVSDDELKAYYKKARGLVNASLYEGFGLPIAEAMSYGLPCIISDIPAYRELFSDAALFFNPKNPAELAEKLEELESNQALRAGLIQKGFEKSGGFSWDRAAQEYREIIENKLLKYAP